ncbi:hypothetical protein C8R44DRAFT_274257 [Mycena epipterygia]|nr:hypothetical protein C8R44DRAFT_274257 [Mycena epipterygia]
MSREDRRPLSQVPEDSVNTCMHHPLPPYAPTQESFTLSPPYNPTDQHIFDTFAYYPPPSDALAYLNDPMMDFNSANHHQPTDSEVQDLTEYPCLYSSMHSPDLPLHTPAPLPAQSSLLLPDPSPDDEALTHNPYLPETPYELTTILNLTDPFPELFANTEYCDFSVAQPVTTFAAAPDLSETSSEDTAAPPARRKKSPRKPRALRVPPVPRASGFVPSDPDDLSSHEKRRLYVACLEQHVQYLHQLFAYLNVQPLPLERVSSYRGLTSRSMRTILLCLGKSADVIHGLTIEEENKGPTPTRRVFRHAGRALSSHEHLRKPRN